MCECCGGDCKLCADPIRCYECGDILDLLEENQPWNEDWLCPECFEMYCDEK